jgi:hypothetical protein
MIPGLGQAFVAEALTKALKSGGEKFIEELCESIPTAQLEALKSILVRVLEKRNRKTIDVKAAE